MAGALGDLGTFLPDVVALGTNSLGPAIPVGAMVFFSGLWSIWAGVLFDIPMPIQPMHTVVAVCLTEGLSYAELVASGVLLGAALLVLGATGLVEVCQRVIPLSVVRGLQLGLGLKTFGVGVRLVLATGSWWTGMGNLDGYAIGLVASAIALGTYGQKRVPASLILFAIGMIGVLLARPAVSAFSVAPFASAPQGLSRWEVWWRALYRAALPQLPVTLLNSVVATARLSEDLYPHRPAAANRIAASVGFMDLTCAWFGHFPSCHGCGGLAGQHLFGARTGSSMALMGLLKMGLALLLGSSLLEALKVFPKGVVGVLLAVSGIELAVPCRDMSGRSDVAVMLLGAGLVLSPAGTGLAFVAAFCAALVLRCRGAFADDEGCHSGH